jgi:pimeloyl-ACP methyl ester carboxylesterase
MLVVLAGAALATAALPGAAAASPERAPAAAADARIPWTPCGAELECARVRVPLDWDRPNKRAIKLSVIRHLASRPEQRIGSIFFNPGGPGGSVERVREEGADLDAVGQGRFDVVGWDIRGAGESAPANCFRSERRRARFFSRWSIPTFGRGSRRVRQKAAALARRCGRLSGGLLRHISTGDTARDLDHLRRLVGDRKLTYVGYSAGTFIGQTYANMFPRRVRALVLDGVMDPVAYTRGTEAGYANQLKHADRGFEGLLRLCESAAPGACALAGKRPVAQRVEQLLQRLQRAPIPAPSADPPGKLTYGEAISAIIVSLSSGPAAWPGLATQLDQAARGDGSALATWGRVLTPAFSSQDSAPGLPAVGLICADSPARRGARAWRKVLDRLTGVSSIYGPVIAWWRWAPCASWPVRSADRYTGPWDASTPNPVLVIGTRFDPNTPYANARRTARRLGNAVLLTHDGYSHVSTGDPSACVKEATSEYLVDLVTPPPGTICPSDRQPFDPDFGEPATP